MIRTLNFAFLAITGLVCLGLYHVAEQARIAQADFKETQIAIVREHDAITVLGAEWARLTQPARIQALTERHLDLTDSPAVEFSSLTQLPAKNPPLAPEGSFRDANIVVPAPAAPTPAPAPAPVPVQTPFSAVLHTGT